MNPKVKKVLDKINNEGIDSVLPYFSNDTDQVLKYLNWGGVIDQLDIESFDDTNIAYGYLLANGYEDKVIQDVIKNMSSISYDGTDYFYEVRNLEELADWFKEYSRDVSPNDVAKGILSEDDWEPFSFSRRDVNLMRDVYDDLSEENKKELRNRIVEKYGNDIIEIPSDEVTDVIEEYGTEVSNGDYEFTVTSQNVLDLFSNDDLMNFLFYNHFDEVGDDLFSLNSVSYNDAYFSEYYDKVWGELRGYFIDSDAKPIDFLFGKVTRYKLKITNVLPRRIKEYVFSDYCEDINNLGAYEYLVSEGFRCDAWDKLSFTIHDWPSSSRLKLMLNDNFNNYF
jgi:hypothetical protein